MNFNENQTLIKQFNLSVLQSMEPYKIESFPINFDAFQFIASNRELYSS